MLPLLFGLAHAGDGVWADLGPVPEGHVLVREDVGPDLIRFELQSPGLGRYWLDVTPLRESGSAGLCQGSGLVVQLRRSLDDAQESFELDHIPAPAQVLCEGLPQAARHLRPVENQPRPPDAPLVAAVLDPVAPLPLARPRPLQAVVLAAGVAAALSVRAWPRDRRLGVLAALFGVALAVRAWAAPVTTLLGGDAAYERLTSALGRGSVDRYYGETWLSALGLVSATLRWLGLSGARPTDFVHAVNLLASALSPPLLAALALRLGLPLRGAAALGMALAVWPQAAGLARIEDHVVLAGALQLVVAVAVLGRSRAERALAVLVATLLGHLRPDQGPTAAVLLLPLAARRDGLAFGAGVVLLGARLAYLPASPNSPIAFANLADLRAWPWMVQAWALAQGRAWPLLVAAGALGGLAAALPRLRPIPAARWAWVAAVAATTVLPYLAKRQPAADPLRFSLPALPWTLLLAAFGLAALWRAFAADRRLAAALALPLAVAAAVPPPDDPFPRPWVWEEEYRFLREVLPTPDTAPTPAPAPDAWYHGGQDPNGAFGTWLSLSSGLRWRAWGSGRPAPGDLVLRGSADRLAGAWPGEACGLEPLQEREVAPRSDGWVDFGPEPVRLALYRVRDCGDRAGEAPPQP